MGWFNIEAQVRALAAGVAQVDSIADLRLATGAQTNEPRYVRGYYSVGDGGGDRVFRLESIAAKSFSATATDDIFTATAHGFLGGQSVRLYGASLPTGVDASTTYYVGAVTTNTFKLSTTYGNATGGSPAYINITADGSGSVNLADDGVFTIIPSGNPSGTRWKSDVKTLPIEAAGVFTNQSAATNTARLLAAAGPHGAHFVFSHGDYPIDNSGGYVWLGAFSGKLEFRNNSRLVFNTNNLGGLRFNSAVGLRLQGVKLVYGANAPTRVQNKSNLLLEVSTDVSVVDYEGGGGPAAGIECNSCIRPSFRDIYVHDQRADGVHINNCKDAAIDNLETDTTGDDGLAFVNYAIYDDNNGARASRIKIRNAGARGISSVGQSNVLVEEFDVDGTLMAGICATYESVYNGTGGSARVPDNVRFASGSIRNAGSFSGYGHADDPTKYGIFAYSNHTTLHSNISFEDIDIDAPASYGVATDLKYGGRAAMKNIRVRNAPSYGFYQTAKSVSLQGCRVEEGNDIGFFFRNCYDVVLSDIVARNCAKTTGTNRVIGFENLTGSPYTNMYMRGSGIKIVDTQATPTGYKITDAIDSGLDIKGDLGEVQWLVSEAVLPAYPTTIASSINIRRTYAGAQSSWQSSAPSTGYWRRGDIVFVSQPTISGPTGFVAATDITAGVGTWQPIHSADTVSADRGDADVTLTTADHRIQRHNTPLTAQRFVDLPTTGLYNGLRFLIVRQGAATGAFNLTPRASGSTLHNLTVAGTWVELVCAGSAWLKDRSGAV